MTTHQKWERKILRQLRALFGGAHPVARGIWVQGFVHPLSWAQARRMVTYTSPQHRKADAWEVRREGVAVS